MGRSPSEHVRATVGKTVRYRTGEREPVEVVVLDVRPSGSTVEDMETGEEWPGVQFKMRPTKGGRAFWSDVFADKHAGALTRAE